MIENITCYICAVDSEQDKRTEGIFVLCPRCGEYWINARIPKKFIGELNDQQIANISHWIRHNQSPQEAPIIDSGNIDAIKNLRTPSVGEKAERLLIHFSKQFPIPGAYIKQHINYARFFVINRVF